MGVKGLLGFHGDERKSRGIHGRCEVGGMETPGSVVEEVKARLTTPHKERERFKNPMKKGNNTFHILQFSSKFKDKLWHKWKMNVS